MSLLVRELPPRLDAWTAACRLARRARLALFDSAQHHIERGRWSYVMADPVRFSTGSTFQEAEKFLRERAVAPDDKPRDLSSPPFCGGIAGVLGYDLNQSLERIPPTRHNDLLLPRFALGEYTWTLAFDNLTNRAWYLNCDGDSGHFQTIEEELAEPGNELSIDFSTQEPSSRPFEHEMPGLAATSNFSREGFLAAVRRAIDYIHAGDAFQVNLAQRLLAPLRCHPLAFYGRLRRISPAPFAAYFDAGEFQIASASPERFLQLSPDGWIATRPIKGTRPRGDTPAADAAIAAELADNHKDRAENVMIVDLLRNDIGRVAAYGTMAVTRVCEVESFSNVHHLVSEIRGRLRPGLCAIDLLRAAFPGGSVTGTPKVRAMEIIAELEPTPRGPYCGSMVMLGRDGYMDSSILIRTATAARGWLHFHAGGGIVADSDPQSEYAETLHKASGFLKTIHEP